MRFSIIVPVYNVEQYLKKCLDSIKKQTFKDFEVIIINDGSTDSSQNIIDKYVEDEPKRFKCFKQENKGLSAARNAGIKKATGEYLFFIDSDDYIDENLFENLNNNIGNRIDLDLLRITVKKIKPNGDIVKSEQFEEKELSGEEAFIYCRNKKIEIVLPWAYCVRTKYWKENHFEFPVGRFHEDFGTVPILLLKAKKIFFVNGANYIYLLRENSIIRTYDYKKTLKKSYDVLYNYDDMKKQLNELNTVLEESKKVVLEYISTAVFQQLNNLNKEDRKKYKKEIIERKLIKNIKLYKGSIRRILIKKIYFRFMLIK